MFHSRTDYSVTLHGVSLVPDLGFNLFSFHVVQGKYEIILNKTGAHLVGGRLVFPRRCNGSSPHATRVLPGGNANVSTAIFVESPSHRSDGPPSPLPNSSVASPIAHQKSDVSDSCRTSNAVARIGEKRSSVAWGTGREPESILSDNPGMAVAVLSPGGVLINKNKKKVVDINHFHVSLAHVHSSVLKATALQQARHSTCGRVGFIFRVFNGEGNPRADSAPHHVPGSGSNEHGAHRQRETVPGITGTLAMCRHVREQRFSLPGPETRAHLPSSVWCSTSWPTWEFRERFGRTTAPSTPNRRSLTTVTVSGSAAN